MTRTKYLTHRRRIKIYKDVILKSLTAGAILGVFLAAWAEPFFRPHFPIPEVKAYNFNDGQYHAPLVDTWVAKYSDKFGRSLSEKNHTKELLHCLLYNESGYGFNKGHGDNGLAVGPLQYHPETWVGFRTIMLKKGLITEIGDRDDMEKSIETTAWAIVDGRALNWGPVLRKYCI